MVLKCVFYCLTVVKNVTCKNLHAMLKYQQKSQTGYFLYLPHIVGVVVLGMHSAAYQVFQTMLEMLKKIGADRLLSTTLSISGFMHCTHCHAHRTALPCER